MSDNGDAPIKSEATSTPPVSEAPDPAAGITSRGWLQILSTFIVFFNTW